MPEWSVIAAILALGAASYAMRAGGFLAAGTLHQQGRLARLLHVGQLSARLSASFVGATVRRTFARGERRARIDAARRQSDAAHVAETMGQMKGALMKLGQMLSFVSDEIPASTRSRVIQSGPPYAVAGQ